MPSIARTGDQLGFGFDPKPMTRPSLSVQEGGGHYKKYPIQPIEFAMQNNLNYCQANVVKYITRYKDKGGVQDLKKAIHNIEILIELEENNGTFKKD
jgi:hypothetical protein